MKEQTVLKKKTVVKKQWRRNRNSGEGTDTVVKKQKNGDGTETR